MQVWTDDRSIQGTHLVEIEMRVDHPPCPWTSYIRRGPTPIGFDKFKDWQDVIRITAEQTMLGRTQLVGPVALEADFFLPLPALPKYLHTNEDKNHTQRQTWLAKHSAMKPDVTNLLKAFEDACNQIIWWDDAQVVKTKVTKQFADYGYTIARIWGLQPR